MESVIEKSLSADTGGGYGFGADPLATAVALRRLAKGLEERAVVLTKAVQYRVASVDDYETTGIVLHFTEAIHESEAQQEKRLVELRGSGSPFPVDTAVADHSGAKG